MAANSKKNYYEILEVDINTNFDGIKSAYRKLARKYHPDVNKDPEAIEFFKEISLAYETLSDETKRNQYNIINGIFKQSEKQEEKGQETKTENNSSKFKNEPKTKKYSTFKTIKYWIAKFKKEKRHRENNRPQKGEDISTEITITPDEVFTGSKRIINVRSTKSCPQCSGHRFANGYKCPKCEGKGVITEDKKITVSIPKGVKDGAKLRLRSEGAAGKNGGVNGDLYIKIKIQTSTQIHYDKLNVYYNVPVTPFEAALGEEITIPVFDGKIKLKLPKNTSSGQKFRISKQGLKKNGKIGDLIVTVSIEFSQDLSEDEIKLYRELKNLSRGDVRKNFGYGC